MKKKLHQRKNRRLIAKDFSPVKLFAFTGIACSLVLVPLASQAFNLGSLLSAAALQVQREGLINAVSINAKQIAVGTSQIIENQKQTAMMTVTGIQGIEANIKMKEHVLKSGTNAALPDSMFCSAIEDRAQAVLNFSLKDYNIKEFMNERAGRAFATSTDEEMAPFAFHFGAACTVEEAKMGVCSLVPNGLQYADIDTSYVFTKSRLSPEQAATALNLASINSNRVAPVSVMACSDASCLDFQNKYLQGSALASLSSFSTANSVMNRVTPMSSAAAQLLEK